MYALKYIDKFCSTLVPEVFFQKKYWKKTSGSGQLATPIHELVPRSDPASWFEEPYSILWLAVV